MEADTSKTLQEGTQILSRLNLMESQTQEKERMSTSARPGREWSGVPLNRKKLRKTQAGSSESPPKSYRRIEDPREEPA